MVGPWAVLMETREHPPPMSETSMLGSLGGADGDPGAPTTYIEDVDGGPLGDTDGDPKPPTTYVGDVDGGPPGRRGRRPRSAHHICQRCRWWAPWEALAKTRECPPPMSEASIVGPLGGTDRDLGASTTYVRDVDGGPLGRC
jgi:hypothetical protein